LSADGAARWHRTAWRPFRPAAALVGCALLAACQTSGPGFGLQPRDAGANLLGEPCRIESSRSKAAPGTEVQFEIYCGDWEQPSARLVRATGPGSLDDLARSSHWRNSLDDYATCQTPQPGAVLGDVPALRFACAVRPGSWSYQAMVARIGDHTFMGDAIPAAEPVLERAIAIVSGREAPPAATAPRGSGDGTLYSAGDLASYRQLLRTAQYYNQQGNYPEAEKLYRKALALQEQKGTASDGGLAYVLMHLGLELSNQVRFAEAAAFFAQAEAVIPYSLDPADEARLVSYRAIDLANQRRSQKAAELAEDASTARRQLVARMQPSPTDAASDRMQAAATMATAAGPRARPQLALRSIGSGEAALGDIVQSRSVEAAMLLRQGELDKADAALADALGVLDQEPRAPRSWRPQILALQGLIAARRGDLSTADALLADSIDAYRRLAPGSRNEALTLLDQGRVRADLGQRQPALESFRAGITLIKAAGNGVRFEDAAPFFDLLLAEAAANPGGRQALLAEMFDVGQLIRSAQTSQSISLAAARLAASDQEAGGLIRDMQDARRERDAATQALARAQAEPSTLAPQLQALEERWQRASARAAAAERQGQIAAPRYNQLLDTPSTPQAVAAALAPNEALLQVIVGQKEAFGFVVDAAGIDAYRIDLGERDALRYATLLRAPFDQSIGAPFDVGMAHELYGKLLAPAAARIAGVKDLIYVPSGPLTSLPLGILVAEPPGDGPRDDYRRFAWVAKRIGVTLAPSVQSFVALRSSAQPSRATKPLVGFGDFVPNRTLEATLQARGLPDSCRTAIKALADMPRLPHTATELEAVRAALGGSGGDIHLRDDFTEKTVRTQPLADYRVVYFATHALLPHDFNCWAEPLLLPSGGGDATGDGLLVASEIAELSLDADLVVLSACNTAAPDGGMGGDSLSGLARAFFYAGARSLLVTHWRIPDAPTQRMMTTLFDDLVGRNVTFAEGLRLAQTALIEDPRTAHPLNWGAFSIVGDGGNRLLPAASSAAAPSAEPRS
jgi:Uncharacterized protein conserved in bacteria